MSSNYSPGTGNTGGSTGGSAADQARRTGSNTAQQLRDTASNLTQQAKDQAEQKFSQQKRNAISEIENLASALRQTAQTVQSDGGRTGHLLETAANRLERLSDQLDAQNLNRLAGDIERFARRNPAAFLGSALALGFFAARFLKASSRGQHQFEYEGSSHGTAGFDSYGTAAAGPGGTVESWGSRPGTPEEL